MRKSTKLFGALAVAGVAAVSGSAFTAGNTVVDSVAGYGSSTVSGAVTTAITHSLSVDGKTITSSTITFETAQTGRTVKAQFGTAALENCALDTAATTATCTYATGVTTSSATAFNVAVS